MSLRFVKMHGNGNDFVVIDAREAAPDLSPDILRRLADRRRGIGCDQVVVIDPRPGLRFFNADGTESGACGNGTRCAAALLAAETGATALTLRTAAGPLDCAIQPDGVRVRLGPPGLGWQDIPLAREADTLHLPLDGHAAAAASLGNPHATLFVPDLAAIDCAAFGAALEHHALFPERANIGFAQITGPDTIRLRVWERGAGLTLACGTGACAALVNAHRRGLVGPAATVLADGGPLRVEWDVAGDGAVSLTGPVSMSFEGVWT